MTDVLKTIAVDINLNSKDFKTKLNEVSVAADKTGRSIGKSLDDGAKQGETAFSSLQEASNKVNETVGKMVKIAAAASVAAIGFAINSASEFQQTRIGIENMLGSADQARDLLQQISDIAKTTPFEFPELASSVKQLLAFGFNAKDAVETMTQLGDVSAAVGAPIGDLTYLMGTLKTQGRAFTIDIRQFAQRGIPIYEYLAKVFNTDTAALTELIESGKVGFPEVAQAFELMTAEGGKFYGTMDKQSESFNGRISTLKDNIGIIARKMVGLSETGDIVKNGLFDKLSTAVADLNIWIDSNQTTVAQWATDFTNFVTNMFNTMATFVAWINANKDWLGPAILGLVAFKTAMDISTAVASAKTLFNGLSLALSTPIVLSISIGAAMAALALLYNEVVKTQNAIDGANRAMKTAQDAYKTASESVQNNPNLSQPEKDYYQGKLNTIESNRLAGSQQDLNSGWTGFFNAVGQSFSDVFGFARGGFTGQGSSNEVAGIVHRGEYVLPKNMVNQSTGMPDTSSTIENHIGTINISSDVDGEKWLQKLTRNQEIVSKGLVPTQRYA